MSISLNINIDLPLVNKPQENCNQNDDMKKKLEEYTRRVESLSPEERDKARLDFTVKFYILRESYGNKYCFEMPDENDSLVDLFVRYNRYVDQIYRDREWEEKKFLCDFVSRLIMNTNSKIN